MIRFMKTFGTWSLALTIAVGLQIASAGTAGASDDTTFKVYWKDGIRASTSDKKFKLKIGGRIMTDFAFWDNNSAINAAIGKQEDASEFRRARLYFAGEVYENVIFKAQYDFAGGDADFKDVYIGLKNVPVLGKVQVGHFFEPFGLEQLTSSKYITFMERATVTAFVPERNTGIGFSTPLLDDRMTFSAGAFHESDGFGDSEGDGYNLTARVTGTPLYADNGRQVVHLGAAYTHRNPNDDEVRFRARPEVHTADRFVDTGDPGAGGIADADEVATFGIEAAAVLGALSVQGEYMMSTVDRDTAADPDFSGYYGYISYFLTGESRKYKPSAGAFSRVKPIENFDGEGGTGAIEVGVRYSSLDLTDAGVTGGELDDITVGVNWHLNPNTRVMLNYVNADVDGVGDADALQARFQIDF